MATLKGTITKVSAKWHRTFAWLGGVALLLFAISGILHPLMVWTGPKAASFFPPQLTLAAEQAAAIPRILQQQGVTQAIMVKVVPTEVGPLLQVTESATAPRRYFDLVTGDEKPGFDQQHAIWLARYYTGLAQAKVTAIYYQTEFDSRYPWVNRLLPVYRVDFATTDQRSVYIYTELGALAGHSNAWRTTLQTLFRNLHTLSWLDDSQLGRVLVMLVLLGALFAMALLGTALLMTVGNRKQPWRQKWHRLLAYGVFLPLLFYSASGTYHLLFYATAEQDRGLALGPAMMLEARRFTNVSDANIANTFSRYQGVKLNALSLVEGPEQKLYYRLSLPQGRPGQTVTRQQRFDGVPIEKPALYVDALTGEETPLNDRDMALYHAEQLTGYSPSLLTNAQRVTHFGPHYDFRNKRLPVWQLDYASEQGDKLFIDPASGVLVDRLVDQARYESYSFSFLHKWNMLRPLIGPLWRDVLVMSVLIVAILSTLLGYWMMLKPKRKR